MCCDNDTTVPEPKETEFSRTLAEIMRERQANARKFQPLEDQLIGEVQRFQTPEYMAQQVGRATSTAESEFDRAREQSDANLASLGVNPNSGAFAGRDRALTLGKALGRVGAAEQARDATRSLAFNTLAGVSGRGDAKVGQAIDAASRGGSLYNDSQRNAMQWQSQQDDGMSGLGQALGLGLSIFSSRRLKKNIKPAEGDAMKAVRAMPARKWKYKGDDKEHVGPMAEDAKKAIGGNGVTLNVADVVGTALAATQNLDKRVRRLEMRK